MFFPENILTNLQRKFQKQLEGLANVIMEASPYELTCVISLSNGAAPGYTYTQEALVEGGYETDTLMLHEDTGYDYVEAAIKLLNKFCEKKYKPDSNRLDKLLKQ